MSDGIRVEIKLSKEELEELDELIIDLQIFKKVEQENSENRYSRITRTINSNANI